MSQEKKNPYVTEKVCQERFKTLTLQIDQVKKTADAINKALIGDPYKQDGLIDEVKEIRRHLGSSLSGKDKVAILTSLIISLAGIVIAWLK